MTEATVLVPTYDHGPTIRHALESALAQTMQDFELLVVGDGAPPATGEIVRELAERDPRVRWLDNPKGPRHGELHRHAALAEARGRVVAYLSDDDLWFPDHLETVCGLLETSDLATAASIKVDIEGGLGINAPDMSNEAHRKELLRRRRAIPLSNGSHTLAAYRRLPRGWSTTPERFSSDRYFWRQFLERGFSASAASHVTVLHFGARHRESMTSEERAAELAGWSGRLCDPRAQAELTFAVATQALDLVGQLRAKYVRQVSAATTASRTAFSEPARSSRSESSDGAAGQGISASSQRQPSSSAGSQ
jgi:GalNAc5-diNAcBac-PP-undecaprenol beta-1,3-glucosyltransferase